MKSVLPATTILSIRHKRLSLHLTTCKLSFLENWPFDSKGAEVDKKPQQSEPETTTKK